MSRNLNRYIVVVLLLVMVFVLTSEVLGHDGGEDASRITINVENIRHQSIRASIAASVVLFILVLIAMASQSHDAPRLKTTLFVLMSGVILVPTIYFVYSSIRINHASETGGPVHWHADFRILACGEELKPPLAPRFSNKVGTPVLHEHEDRRLHVEGVLIEKKDASLENFFAVQGGDLQNGKFVVPTEMGLQTFINGDACPDGTVGEWNVFLYKTEDGVATQYRLDDYADYVLSPEINVPPGDCVIFEFGEKKIKTDLLCDFYQIEVNKGDLRIR